MLKEIKLSKLYLYLAIAVFATILSSALSSFFESDFMEDIMSLVQLASTLAELVIIYVLSKNYENFKNAFILIFISSVISFVLSFDGVAEVLTFTTFASVINNFSGVILEILVPMASMVASVLVDVFAAYYLFNGHSGILMGIDDTLASKWKKLFDWYKLASVGMIAGIVIFLFIGTLGVVVVLLAGIILFFSVIGLWVVQCLEIYYLYNTYEALLKNEANQ